MEPTTPTTDKPCTRCGTPTGMLEAFPGHICLTCYRPIGDALARTMAAGDLAVMWGAKPARRTRRR